MRAGMRIRALGLLALGTAACGGYTPTPESLAPEQLPRLGGARVTVQYRGARPTVAGELIAARDDSLWVLTDRGLIGAALADVAKVRVRRHNVTAGNTLLWGLVAGVATGGGLASACASAHCDSPGTVFTSLLGSWLVFAGISAVANEASSNAALPDVTSRELRPYARFPQGWPPGLVRSTLERPPR